jgi:dethiobiotin synthetase
MPAAPQAAADAEGVAIDPLVLARAFGSLHAGGRLVVAEGAGGAATPYGPDLLGMDLARVLGVPVLLVARAALGTVGQSLACLRAMEAARIECRGVVLSRVPGSVPGPEDPTNAPLIEVHSGSVPVLGTLPLVDPAPTPLERDACAAWAARCAPILAEHVDLDRLLR